MGRKRDLVSKTANRFARPISAVLSGRKERYEKSPRLVILMFHHVAEQQTNSIAERDLLLTPDEFRNYCEFFKKRFLICTLHEAQKHITEGCPGILLVFSFDDGYTDFYETAFPILKELNIPVNQNIIVKYANKNEPGYLNWNQIRELKESGLVEFGSHTFDEHHLVDNEPIVNKLSREEILEDLKQARKSFQDNLGATPDILAWPYGAIPRTLRATDYQELGIQFQLTTISGMNVSPIDFNRLKRFAVLGYEKPEKLERIIQGYDALGFMTHKI